MACASELIKKCSWICQFVLVPILKLSHLFSLVHKIREQSPKFLFLLPFLCCYHLKGSFLKLWDELGVHWKHTSQKILVWNPIIPLLVHFSLHSPQNITLSKFTPNYHHLLNHRQFMFGILGWLQLHQFIYKCGHIFHQTLILMPPNYPMHHKTNI